MQLGDQYKANLDIRQNRIMTILTVVTTIFMPLTLIVGWYGMNFRYMPELEWRWGYPVIIAVSLLIAIGCLLFFKKKKWL
jgi:magnesium transporter